LLDLRLPAVRLAPDSHSCGARFLLQRDKPAGSALFAPLMTVSTQHRGQILRARRSRAGKFDAAGRSASLSPPRCRGIATAFRRRAGPLAAANVALKYPVGMP